jgi:hypothetical protein
MLMALREYHKIDLQTGERLDVLLFDDEATDENGNPIPVPEDLKLGWGGDRGFYNPKWDFELNDWVEGKPLEEILQPIRQQKVIELNRQCEEAICKGFEHNGDFFQFNDKDQDNFSQQLSLLLLDPSIDSVVWKTENNGVKVFTREQFIEACKVGEHHKRNNIEHYWQLKEYVLTHPFNSVEELQSIDFSFTVPNG